MRRKFALVDWKRVMLWTLGIVGLAALAIGPFHIPYGSYSGRNGVIEALDDIAAHRPIKLYGYRVAQLDYISRTPGLYCQSDGVTPGLFRFKHVMIDEALASEGYLPSWIEMRRGEAARSFAYLYNMTIFRKYESQLRRACPRLIVEPYGPNLFYRPPTQRPQ